MAERVVPSFDAATGQLWVCAYEPMEQRLAATPLSDYIGKADNGQSPEYRYTACIDHLPYEAVLGASPLTDAEKYAQLISGSTQNIEQ